MDIKVKKLQDAVNYFYSLPKKDQERITSECPDSWKKNDDDFYDWVSDLYSNQIQKFITPISYREIAKNYKSTVKLKCIIAYNGMESTGFGRTRHFAYKVGDVMQRNIISSFKPNNWEINK